MSMLDITAFSQLLECKFYAEKGVTNITGISSKVLSVRLRAMKSSGLVDGCSSGIPVDVNE